MSFDTLFKFEKALAEYTGAPYAVVTDGCTHALELCFRLDRITYTEFTAFTYLSILQLMNKLNVSYELKTEYWNSAGEYQFAKTNIWDSARLLKPGGWAFFSTVNRNLKSYAFGVIAAEYMLKLLPKGTHEYKKFIKPSELRRILVANGFEIISLRGIGYNPLTHVAELNQDVDINYIIGCRKCHA